MSLGQRVADRLQWTRVRLAATGLLLPAPERGLCVDGPDAPTVVLTVEVGARFIPVTITEHELAELQDSCRRRLE